MATSIMIWPAWSSGKPPTPVPSAVKAIELSCSSSARLQGAVGGGANVLRGGGEVLAHRGGVNDVAGSQASAAGDDRFADLNRALADRLVLDLTAAGAHDRAGRAGAHPEMVVGGVDDRVGVLGGDVALDDLDLGVGHARHPASIYLIASALGGLPVPPRTLSGAEAKKLS